MKAGELNPAVNDLLAQAKELAAEQKELFERKGANRNILRNYVKTKLCNKEQADAIAAFYPVPKKKDEKTTAAAAS